MEGLPSQGDELRYLCSKGLYPDAIVILEVHVHLYVCVYTVYAC